MSGRDLGERSGAKDGRSRLLIPPPLVSSLLMTSQTRCGSSDGEVGVFTSQIVINGPPVMTSSVVDSGMSLTCLTVSILPVAMVTSELSSLMVTTLPEVVS